jgi:NTP pyrophosphatase (non-canonical NTP hydrolase)
MEQSTKALIDKAIDNARKKHPIFAHDEYHVASVLSEEAGEFACAINDGDIAHAIDEAADIIAVCVRFLEDFYPRKK